MSFPELPCHSLHDCIACLHRALCTSLCFPLLTCCSLHDCNACLHHALCTSLYLLRLTCHSLRGCIACLHHALCTSPYLPVLTYHSLRDCIACPASTTMHLGSGLEQFFERRSGDRTRVDGFCDFEKVPPDQLCPGCDSYTSLAML